MIADGEIDERRMIIVDMVDGNKNENDDDR